MPTYESPANNLTGGSGPGPQVPQRSRPPGNMMGPEYGNPGYRWSPDAPDLYNAQHSIDPRTGEVMGPWGAVPWQVSLNWQQAHEQAVWAARYRMGREALQFMQGSAGMLSSFRAGGGAAMESGVYSQMAGIQLQRAQMHQPMDLLGDYRREQAHRNKSQSGSGRTERLIGTTLSAIGGVVSAAGYPYIGIPLSAAGGYLGGMNQPGQPQALQYGGGQQGGQQGSQQGAGQGGGQYGGLPGQQPVQPSRSGAKGQQGGSTAWEGGPPSAPQPNQGATGGSPVGGPPSPGASGPTGQAHLGQQPGAPGGGGTGAGAQAQGPQMAASMMPTGALTGDVTSTAYVANGLAQTPFGPQLEMALSENLATLVREDPTLSMIDMQTDQEMFKRMQRYRKDF